MNQEAKNEENSEEVPKGFTIEELKQMTSSIPKELATYLSENGYRSLVQTPNKGLCGIKSFAFTTAIVIGIDETGYYGRYCFPNAGDCIISYARWLAEQGAEGDPTGNWIKYKGYPFERSNKNYKKTDYYE